MCVYVCIYTCFQIQAGKSNSYLVIPQIDLIWSMSSKMTQRKNMLPAPRLLRKRCDLKLGVIQAGTETIKKMRHSHRPLLRYRRGETPWFSLPQPFSLPSVFLLAQNHRSQLAREPGIRGSMEAALWDVKWNRTGIRDGECFLGCLYGEQGSSTFFDELKYLPKDIMKSTLLSHS